MQDLPWTALTTLTALILYLVMIMRVGSARATRNVAAPATVGDPIFERHFRVHMNTLESLAAFLPALWLCAVYWSDPAAAAIGAGWIAGRIIYMVSYVREPGARTAGFLIQGLAIVVLIVGAFVGVGRVLLS